MGAESRLRPYEPHLAELRDWIGKSIMLVHSDASRRQNLANNLGSVGTMIAEGLSRPLARDEYAPSAISEMFDGVRSASAGAGNGVCVGTQRLDAVAKPIGAP